MPDTSEDTGSDHTKRNASSMESRFGMIGAADPRPRRKSPAASVFIASTPIPRSTSSGRTLRMKLS
ncbi:hypothetical protein D3C83_234600 [compost metagenome]